MPRYQMREHLFSFGDDFTVKDESGRDVFYIDGKALSIGLTVPMNGGDSVLAVSGDWSLLLTSDR